MEEAIISCYKKMYQGMIDKNAKLLDKCLHDDFVLIHMTGLRQPKQVFINSILDGTLNYYHVEHQHFTIDQKGNDATMIGQSKVLAAVFGGSKGTWRLQLDLSLVKKDHWKISRAIASTY